jgi:hypothetical protein
MELYLIARPGWASMYMVHKHLYEPHKHAEYKNKQLCIGIIGILLKRAKIGNLIIMCTYMEINSHIGFQGNDIADQLAGDATDRS